MNVMAMVLINKETKERELLWTPDLDEVNADEEIRAALTHFGDEIIEEDDGTITGEKFHITFELVG